MSKSAFGAIVAVALAASCGMDQAPNGLRLTPSGPGATVRYDLAHKPLPDIPIPTDSATWQDPTSRTGLRINASLVAPTNIEREARERFSQMEGWGTFAPISVSFDIDKSDPAYAKYTGPAIDLANVAARHQGDDYDFADDAVYLVNLTTGVPVPLDLGAGNFNYTLKELNEYWANDTRATERNLLFETIDESKQGAITPSTFKPSEDTDFDGILDQPDLDEPFACPGPDAACNDVSAANYLSPKCLETRRLRDRCMADHLLAWYERETDTLILRPVLPMDEMTRYAVVITDRMTDGLGHPVKSPFSFVYHDTMEAAAKRVKAVMNDTSKAAYFGDIAGTGLDHVAFLWSFTTQPTVDDMKRLRDGLYGQGPFARWAKQYPPEIEVERLVGLNAGLSTGATDPPNWETSSRAKQSNCVQQEGDLYVVNFDAIRSSLREVVIGSFGYNEGPPVELLLEQFDNIDHLVIGTYKSPFLIEGGPKGTDPNAAFDLNFVTGKGFESHDTVPFLLVVPKETKEHHQPFDVDIYGHGYTGNFTELLLYAGNMAKHGLATIGIDAVGHGLSLDPATSEQAKVLLDSTCVGPLFDALTLTRARDLDNDGIPDSGADFWSSYLFHTRDGVRQSVLDHVQLVRILRSFGTKSSSMLCRNKTTGWEYPAIQPCDVNDKGKTTVAGDFDGDGVPDVGGPDAKYSTWGESLGGILSSIHGALDTYVGAAVPGSGGGGLTDIGVRSFQGGVIEAVLLRVWGPLLVSVPATERPACTPASVDGDFCTVCSSDELSVRWVMPNLNGTGELEIDCLSKSDVANSTWLVDNGANGEQKCASPDAAGRIRIGVPASIGDQIEIDIYDGANRVTDYASCKTTFDENTVKPRKIISAYGKGRLPSGNQNAQQTASCEATTCGSFQGNYFGEGDPLTAPAEGYGLIRQTPDLRRFLQLAQAALDPGDPVNFAPYYSIKSMTDPFGKTIGAHAVLTLDTIGDMNVPLNTGIEFARAAGALPLFRPDEAAKYPDFIDYVTPPALFAALGKTPNRVLVDDHVIEGIAPLARYPAATGCVTSQNARPLDTSIVDSDGNKMACFPKGCATAGATCWDNTVCDMASDQCLPIPLGQETCDEALFDVDVIDEGTSLFFEQSAAIPLRLARYTQPATASTLADVWQPRIAGVPFSKDGSWVPNSDKPLTALLDAYIVPGGVHTFVNGDPCQNFDNGTYLTNLVARFFMTGGTDLYYLSHPKSHLCLGRDVTTCDYMK